MRVKIDDFLKHEFENLKVPYDFTKMTMNIFENKKSSNTLIHIYFKVASCVGILLVTLSILYMINIPKKYINNTLINVSTENDTNNENNENDNSKEPYKIIGYSSSKAYDVTDVKKLYENVDIIVTGKVVEKKDAQISKTIPIIHTPGKLTVFNVIKGAKINNIIDFIVSGGKVSLEYYENSIKNIYPENTNKEDFSMFDADFKKKNYVLYRDEYSNDFYIEQEYVMFLNKIENTNIYAVVSYAGMIPVNNSANISSIDQIYNLEKVNKH